MTYLETFVQRKLGTRPSEKSGNRSLPHGLLLFPIKPTSHKKPTKQFSVVLNFSYVVQGSDNVSVCGRNPEV